MNDPSVNKVASVALLISLLTLPAIAGAAQSSSAPQTARQALLEMFFSKETGTLVKHLPAVTVNALTKAGAFDQLQQYSVLAGQLQKNGSQIETFETGTVILSTKDPKTGNKFDVIVENDSLQGDTDNIELSFQTYKENQVQRTPYMPSLTFSMKMENGIWKVDEIDLTVRVSLTDPDFLKIISQGLKNKATGAGTASIQSHQSLAGPAAESSITSAMRTILAAETAYSAAYPTVGYTCTLTDLDGFGSGEPNEHQAMLIPASLASGHRFGYHFKLAGCTGSAGGAATKFEMTATPSGNDPGQRTFCSDQSGAIHSSTNGEAACRTNGAAIQF